MSVMSRRSLLKGVGALGAALTGQSREPAQAQGGGSTFYLAADGDDDAEGVSATAPWKTIDRLNAAMAANQVRQGDSVLFRRGDTFHGRIENPGHTNPYAPWMVFDAYGTGPRPIISAYKVAVTWISQGDNVWAIDLSASSSNYVGARSDNTDVGFLKVDGETFGSKRASRQALKNQWDFFSGSYDNPHGQSTLYVRSVRDPGQHAIKIAVSGPWTEGSGSPDVCTPATKTSIRGLDLQGSAGHGVSGSAYWQPKFVQVVDCTIREIGGAYAPGHYPGTRLGNGVQAWIGQSDWQIERNRIKDVFDAGVTYQGSQEGVRGSFVRLQARRNEITNCGQSFEWWSSGTDGAGFIDCSFSENTCRDAGMGWGHAVRIDPAGRGTHLLAYQQELPCDLRIQRNAFLGAKTNYLFALSGVPMGAVLSHNQVALSPGTSISHQRPESISQWRNWQASTGLEAGSVFTVAS
ncbi:hypothetical protein [Ornithinimicrobium pratense]|uniref:Right-handed parallel beta-helix repeat-containing protein n=1 Tax=Ornithinimicrobium pratense TaxID=2593973 RepID=A0A5J6V6S5_9MICO|nr:hypothetical protein [Ornithinimicrobium pratense]QFG69720.1 hypothetical protein FY030_14330 [Ornithinimicrobium pratense]